MKEFEGKAAYLIFEINGKNLFYRAKEIKQCGEHIIFTDKFDKQYCFRKKDLVEISPFS